MNTHPDPAPRPRAQATDHPTDQAAFGRVGGRRRVTMTDIARAAGCSQATVSCVLNANFSVQLSDATRERVLAVARDLGYEAPALPGLSGAVAPVAARAIAFVVDSLVTSPEAVVAIDGIRQGVKGLGHVVVAAETGNDPVLEPRTLGMFIDQKVLAIVYACLFTREVTLPAILDGVDMPVVLLNCYSADFARPAVVPSEIAGGQRATEVLITAGHRRIGTITGETFMEAAQDRLEGYRRALASADIPFDPALVKEGDWSPSAGYRGTRALLALDAPPTAIVCQNDRMAIGCYEALKEGGLSIPGDMSVVGYDDDEIARHLFPPLTTLILPHRAMGRWAVEQVLHGSGPGGASRGTARYPVTKLECELVTRRSVARPASR